MVNENVDEMKVHEVGDLAFLRRYTESRLTEGYLPIWRHVIAMSIVNLMKMHSQLALKTPAIFSLFYSFILKFVEEERMMFE